MDIIERAAKLGGELIVAVLVNSEKNAFFSADERVGHLRKLTKDISNVRIESFSGLLVDFCVLQNAPVVIRGLRAVSDFEYEFQMALTNRRLNDKIEVLFLPSALEYQYLNSSIAKEVARLGGSVDGMVPELIIQALRDKFS
jgi:pantetheine-phosphate adenylyltransferase